MRTTAKLLCAAAIAAGAVTAMAQTSNVYSLNVVGYVNYQLGNGQLTLVCNPLDNTNSDLNTLVQGLPNGSQAKTWNASIGDFDSLTSVYRTSSSRWNRDWIIAPGQAFFLTSLGVGTNIWIGNARVQTSGGALPQYVLGVTNVVVGVGAIQAVGTMLPTGGDMNSAVANGTNVLAGYPAGNGDQLKTWNASIGDFDSLTAVYRTSSSRWNRNWTFNVGDGFFLIRLGAATNWVQTFTVQ